MALRPFSLVRLPGSAPGDVLLAISTSGNSPNVACGRGSTPAGLHTLGLLGKDGGRLKEMVIALVVPSFSTQRIQEVHITWGTSCAVP